MTLAQWLKESGWSMRRLARELGVDASAVSRWLRGGREPKARALAAIERLTEGKVTALSFR